jgi:hypothetical protein
VLNFRAALSSHLHPGERIKERARAASNRNVFVSGCISCFFNKQSGVLLVPVVHEPRHFFGGEEQADADTG